jgi:hypothetical protein
MHLYFSVIVMESPRMSDDKVSASCRSRPQGFTHSAVFALLLGVACTLVPAGCGESKPTGLAPPEDPAATAARNKSMEDYMKSSEGKAATKGPK